jgi:adenylosuccinate synthase
VPSPIDAEDYDELVPVYESVPGWNESTLGIRELQKLPANARAYIQRIEAVVGAPIDIISTGPDRVETIVLRHPFA